MRKLLRVIWRVCLRLVGTTAVVFAVLYLTPGSLWMTIGDDVPHSRIVRRSGLEERAEKGKKLFSGDAVIAGSAELILEYEADQSSPVVVQTGKRFVVGGLAELVRQYRHWLGAAVGGELGYYRGVPVATRLVGHTGKTVVLVGGGLLLSLVMATGLALASLRYGTSPLVGGVIGLANALSGVHVLILGFAVIGLGLVEPTGQFSLWLVAVLAMGSGSLSDYYAVLREHWQATVSREYVVSARARGASGLKHAFYNEALLGMIEATAARVPTLVGGTIMVEWVFAYLGLGYDIVRAIQDRDFELIMGVTVVVAAMLLVVVEMADLARRGLDPRMAEEVA